MSGPAGAPVTDGYMTVAGLVAARDDQGWYDTGDLGYLTETGNVVVRGSPGRRAVQGDVRGRGGVRGVAGQGRGAPHRASGGARGGAGQLIGAAVLSGE
jgi:hypothetical protein